MSAIETTEIRRSQSETQTQQPQTAAKVSRNSIITQAIRALGPDASTQDIIDYCKAQYAIDVSKGNVYSAKNYMSKHEHTGLKTTHRKQIIGILVQAIKEVGINAPTQDVIDRCKTHYNTKVNKQDVYRGRMYVKREYDANSSKQSGAKKFSPEQPLPSRETFSRENILRTIAFMKQVGGPEIATDLIGVVKTILETGQELRS